MPPPAAPSTRAKRKAQDEPAEAGPSSRVRLVPADPIPSARAQQLSMESFAAAISYQVALNLQADIEASVQNARRRVAECLALGGFEFEFPEPVRRAPPERPEPKGKGKGKGKAKE
jgi:hypothetical protein